MGLNVEQLYWASQHGWYCGHSKVTTGPSGYQVEVREVVSLGLGKVTIGYKEFTDFQELKEWAGY